MRRDFDPFVVSKETWAFVYELTSDNVLLSWWFVAELLQAFDERRDFTVRTSFG